MVYNEMGNSGLRISPLCFGTMSFGGDADKAESKKMFTDCLDAGINMFDCANVYQKGAAESLLGEFAAGKRHELIITTKAYFPMSDSPNDRGSTRRNLTLSLNESLKRLNTDYVDIFFLHQFDERTSLEESIRTLDDFVRRGQILYIGLSNFAAWQVQKALGLAALGNASPPHCIQPMYNLAKRQAEVELLPMARSEGLGAFSYSPLGGGLLTGKFSSSSRPEGSRLTSNEMYKRRYAEERYYRIAEDFTALAKKWDVDPVTLSVSWVKSHPAITAPIIGARNSNQLRASLAAMDYVIPSELAAEIDEISPPPPPATDRSEESGNFGYERMLK